MYPCVEDLIGFFTEDEEDCCCCCFCCCCLLSYVKETAGGEGISPVTLLQLVDGPSTPPQTAPCMESAALSLLFHKEWWLINNLMHVDRNREYHKISKYQASWCMNMNFILTLLFLEQYISRRTPSQHMVSWLYARFKYIKRKIKKLKHYTFNKLPLFKKMAPVHINIISITSQCNLKNG